MKKKYIVFGALAISSLHGFTQRPANYAKKKISKTTIQIVYSQYLQNGDHSAVTGGIGTERLKVYSPSVNIKHQADSLTVYSLEGGVDVISSASKDNIDFIVSSSSKVSSRAYLHLGYDRKLKRNNNITLGGAGYFSIESDYLSVGGKISGSYVSPDKSKDFSAELQGFSDDLRWGRLTGESPLKLIYPFELRYKNWFSVYRRQSFNLNLAYQQTINERMIIAFFPGASYQYGLLSTPYHRVYFKDSTERVENVPDKRWKIPLGVQLNSFIGDRYILRLYYRYYTDDFGITAHSFNTELGIKMTSSLTLTPLTRLYTQKAASFFKPYRQHDPLQQFYTSDYDLSAFNSYELGIEGRLAGVGKAQRSIYTNTISLRYSFYKRSDGLYAHLMTLVVELIGRSNKK
jgi:hypothetical protein